MPKYTIPQHIKEIPHGYCMCGCGQKTRIAPQSRTNRGWIKGQPLKCISGHSKRYALLSDSLWSRVDIKAKDECWPWMGSTNSDGYGTLKFRGKYFHAHRVAYELTNGPIPNRLNILHRCDNPPCCNPAHLWPGTDQDNVDDMMAKRRNKVFVGTQNRSAKVTEDDIPVIRALYAQGNLSQQKIGVLYGVSDVTVSYIIHRKTWRHVP